MIAMDAATGIAESRPTTAASDVHDEAPGDSIDPDLDHFTAHQLRTFREAFAGFDRTNSGYCVRTDLGPALRVLGFQPTEAELKKLIDEFQLPVPEGQPPSGRIDYIAFLRIVARQMGVIATPEAMINAFKAFDDTGRGYVTARELHVILERLGDNPVNPELVDAMIAWADPEESGLIPYEAFVRRLFTDASAIQRERVIIKAAEKAAAKKR